MMRALRFRPALKDVFTYTRVVGQRAGKLLTQVAFVSGGGEAVLSTFLWRPADEIYTLAPVGKETMRLVGGSTPSLKQMSPLIRQICDEAHVITVNLDVQRELLPAGALDNARRVTELPDALTPHLFEPGLASAVETTFADLDRTHDAASVAFRILYLWSGARPTGRHMPMLHESWEGLERFAP